MNKLIAAVVFAAVLATSFVMASFLFTGKNSIELKLVQLDNGPFYLFNSTHMYIEINNTGNSYIKNMVLGVYVNGKAYRAFNVSLPPHEGAAIPLNYTFASAGNFEILAVADPAKIMNLTGRTSAYLYLNASLPASNPYTIKTSNTIFMYNFTMIENMLPILAENSNITSFHNSSGIEKLFNIDGSILKAVTKALYGTISVSYGISLEYSNRALCNELSISGTATPAYINQIIGSFPVKALTENGINVFEYKNTTICTFYGEGYTHIILYRGLNGTNTCIDVIGNSTFENPGGEINNFAKSMVQKKGWLGNEFYKSRNFSEYTSMLYSGNAIIFAKLQIESANTSSNTTVCTGEIYNKSCINVYKMPFSDLFGYTGEAIEVNQINSSSKLALIGFTNTSNQVATAQNIIAMLKGISLEGSYNFSYPILPPPTCSISELKCINASFNYTSYYAVMDIYNPLNYSITITNASCYMPGLQKNAIENTTIAPGKQGQISARCYTIPAMLNSALYTYSIYVQYIKQGKVYNATGFLNVTVPA